MITVYGETVYDIAAFDKKSITSCIHQSIHKLSTVVHYLIPVNPGITCSQCSKQLGIYSCVSTYVVNEETLRYLDVMPTA